MDKQLPVQGGYDFACFGRDPFTRRPGCHNRWRGPRLCARRHGTQEHASDFDMEAKDMGASRGPVGACTVFRVYILLRAMYEESVGQAPT